MATWLRSHLPYWLFAASALVAAPGVRADIWSYVDERGVAHFASSQLDPRYEVFLHATADTGTDTANGARATPVVKDHAGAARVSAYLDGAPNFRAVEHLVRAAASTHHIDFALLKALIATESGFDAMAISPKGAIGLMQVIPDTANRYGLVGNRRVSLQTRLQDPRTNLQTGSRYLRDLLDQFPGQLELALAAYNAGAGAVQKAGNRVPDFPETQNYVKTVTQLYYVLNPLAAPRSQHAVGAVPSNGVITNFLPPAGTSRRGNMVPSLSALPLAVPRAP